MIKCPGQDMRLWKPEDIFESKCPFCGNEMEFWKDEPFLLCRICQKEVRNPRLDLGCAEWCKYAEECLGKKPEASESVQNIREKIIQSMKEVFGKDQKRIEHALKVLDYAEKINKEEKGADLIVKAAAILHDIGIKEAENKYGSSAPKYQEIEGPPIARRILSNYNIDSETIDHICRIIGSHHSANDIKSKEFDIVWDADWLVNFHDVFPDLPEEKLHDKINEVFRTSIGRQTALSRLKNKQVK